MVKNPKVIQVRKSNANQNLTLLLSDGREETIPFKELVGLIPEK